MHHLTARLRPPAAARTASPHGHVGTRRWERSGGFPGFDREEDAAGGKDASDQPADVELDRHHLPLAAALGGGM